MELDLGATLKVELLNHNHHTHMELLECGSNTRPVAQFLQVCIFQNLAHDFRVFFVLQLKLIFNPTRIQYKV